MQTNEPMTDDVERNKVRNVINHVSNITPEVFSEAVHLVNHAFRPWPKDRRLDTMGLPRCPISEPEAAEQPSSLRNETRVGSPFRTVPE